MTSSDHTLYTTVVHSRQNPDRVQIDQDEGMALSVLAPPELGGPGRGEGWNPEQLYAAAVASCVHQALTLAASEMKADCADSRVTAEVSLEHSGPLRYAFSTDLSIDLPRLADDLRARVIDRALSSCPMAANVRTTGT